LNHVIYPDLKGKFSLITGASRGNGIGAAACRALSMQGTDILFTTWQAHDREQSHGADEPTEVRLAKPAFHRRLRSS
jgi:3-oxoacyl-[acyl-carrier protein] reductase